MHATTHLTHGPKNVSATHKQSSVLSDAPWIPMYRFWNFHVFTKMQFWAPNVRPWIWFLKPWRKHIQNLYKKIMTPNNKNCLIAFVLIEETLGQRGPGHTDKTPPRICPKVPPWMESVKRAPRTITFLITQWCPRLHVNAIIKSSAMSNVHACSITINIQHKQLGALSHKCEKCVRTTLFFSGVKFMENLHNQQNKRYI